ncbi:hypothetical protein B0H13DRAFT_1907922 [Mycena leptocephala]|nr:hypothetical protein B0H13DRAFT_1907922 [Mycena leptocephala]
MDHVLESENVVEGSRRQGHKSVKIRRNIEDHPVSHERRRLHVRTARTSHYRGSRRPQGQLGQRRRQIFLGHEANLAAKGSISSRCVRVGVASGKAEQTVASPYLVSPGRSLPEDNRNARDEPQQCRKAVKMVVRDINTCLLASRRSRAPSPGSPPSLTLWPSTPVPASSSASFGPPVVDSAEIKVTKGKHALEEDVEAAFCNVRRHTEPASPLIIIPDTFIYTPIGTASPQFAPRSPPWTHFSLDSYTPCASGRALVVFWRALRTIHFHRSSASILPAVLRRLLFTNGLLTSPSSLQLRRTYAALEEEDEIALHTAARVASTPEDAPARHNQIPDGSHRPRGAELADVRLAVAVAVEAGRRAVMAWDAVRVVLLLILLPHWLSCTEMIVALAVIIRYLCLYDTTPGEVLSEVLRAAGEVYHIVLEALPKSPLYAPMGKLDVLVECWASTIIWTGLLVG